MNKILIKAITILVVLSVIRYSAANDSAAGIAANGIYLKEEKNISIEREDLFIGEKKIEVNYIFKNHSNKDITTEIAFPIPDYDYDPSDMTVYPMYDEFTVEVNGRRINHKEESRAYVGTTDYTDLLHSLDISIRDFGNFDEYIFYENRGSKGTKPKSFFEKLSKTQQQLLLSNKLVVRQGNFIWPNWKVSRKYHWTQTFPANTATKIHHSYSPYTGDGYFLSSINPDCADAATKKWLKNNREEPYRTVNYILTTANNWKQPIEIFHLVIDNGGTDHIRIVTCFSHELRKISSSRYEATVANFTPKSNITVYFIGAPKQK